MWMHGIGKAHTSVVESYLAPSISFISFHFAFLKKRFSTAAHIDGDTDNHRQRQSIPVSNKHGVTQYVIEPEIILPST
jgi:hypothetical protein